MKLPLIQFDLKFEFVTYLIAKFRFISMKDKIVLLRNAQRRKRFQNWMSWLISEYEQFFAIFGQEIMMPTYHWDRWFGTKMS